MAATDVAFGDRAAYLPDADALVLADLHVGRDAASRVSLPLGERADLLDRLTTALDRFEPGTVVFAGDLLHSFDEVPAGARETVAALVGAVRDAGANPVVTPGNHDTMLDAVLASEGAAERESDETLDDVPTPDELALGDAVVCHGHAEPDTDADRYVVGHEHPAITIEGRRRPCFLYGPGTYRGADVLVLPAFSRLASGTEVNGLRTADCLSPLVTDIGAFRPVVVSDGDPLAFPPLRKLRRHL